MLYSDLNKLSLLLSISAGFSFAVPSDSYQSSSSSPSTFVFSPYQDITEGLVGTTIDFTLAKAAKVDYLTLAFATGECGAENWAGADAGGMASNIISQLKDANIKYIVSAGGANQKFTCSSDDGFTKYLKRYASDNLIGFDFDLECTTYTQSELENIVKRVKAAQSNPEFAHLRFSFTIASFGSKKINISYNSGSIGDMVVSSAKAQGLKGVYYNLMAMDYGGSYGCTADYSGKCDMGKSAIAAAEVFSSTQGIDIAFVEVTPMIGENDSQDEIFSQDDATALATYAAQKHLGGVHFWSLTRDRDCPSTDSLDKCSRIKQKDHAFYSTLKAGLSGVSGSSSSNSSDTSSGTGSGSSSDSSTHGSGSSSDSSTHGSGSSSDSSTHGSGSSSSDTSSGKGKGKKGHCHSKKKAQ